MREVLPERRLLYTFVLLKFGPQGFLNSAKYPVAALTDIYHSQERKIMTHKSFRRATALVFLALAGIALFWSTLPTDSSAQATQPPAQVVASPAAAQALARLQSSSTNQIVSHVSRATGVFDFVRASGTGVLPSADNFLGSPESRARAFLSQNGDLVGMSALERTLVASSSAPSVTVAASALRVAKISTDSIGSTHVKFDQTYKGLKVFGAQVVVHMKSTGITAINGNFVPGVNVSRTPRLSTAQAAQRAIGSASNLSVANQQLSVYRTGLLEGQRGQNVLAYAVEVTDGNTTREQVFIDATKGTELNRINLILHGLDRIIYTPAYGEPFDVRHEGDPYTPGPEPGTTGAEPINNLYRFAGETYNLYRAAFGRDSYDGLGHTMHSVLLANQHCPNAYWNGVSTNYCPDFDADDVVSHEWTHGYTEYTHNLTYAYQPGALNEAYSDIFGETHDLLNGVDAEGGANNAQPMPDGQRWQMGEDVNVFNQPAAGILRDMWDPTRFGDPDKVSSPNYACGSADSGGLHTNSGVVNHCYAMLVDGKTFNGQTVEPIGFARALAIYYRAMTAGYQTSTTDFPAHAQALQASCNDLIGHNPNTLTTASQTSTPSGDIITAHTCQQVDKAILAVELNLPPPCPVIILLDPDAPEACPGSGTIFSEDWEDGNMNGWTKTSAGTFPEWEDASRPLRDFTLSSTAPAGHAGITALAKAPKVGEPGGGGCTPLVDDYSGQFSIDSPTITIPAGANEAKLSFEHYVDTEAGVDGGQVELSINGGPFQLVSSSEYEYNYPKTVYNQPPPVGNNTNPNPGEAAWTGANVGTPVNLPPGSWGTTIIDLSSLTNPGDTVKVRFNFSQDGCNGTDGWYIDNIRVYSCPLLDAPVLSLGGDYQNPDPDGSYTLTWVRPVGATGPDLVQESLGSCAPLLYEDAESGMDGWTVTNVGTGAIAWTTATDKPQHTGTTFKGSSINGTTNNATILTYNNPIAIPATGTTFLTFDDWDVNEGEDNVYVEASTDGGTTWSTVYQHNRSALAPDAAVAFATEALFNHAVNLASYGGQSIRLRFRFQAGPEDRPGSAPMGWYLDNIAINNDSWNDLASTSGTSYLVTGRPSGTRCYRVRTTYTIGAEPVASPFSNEVEATSSLVGCLVNFAHSSQGSVATASSTQVERNYSPAGAINGDVTGAGWEQGGGWNDDTRDVWPDHLEVNFNASRTIDTITVYTVQNDFNNPVQPTPTTPADVYGILDFDVQYWNGSAWVTVPGGEIRGNDKAMRTVSFANITTTRIRINVLNGRVHYSRIVEVEATGCP
jgi:Zn-dependent metalloprotease